MITSCGTDHIAFVRRETAERMLASAQSRLHFCRSAKAARRIEPYVAYLRHSLRMRGETVSLKGSLGWYRELVSACGDASCALEIGMKLATGD